jgi:hypothetical protein
MLAFHDAFIMFEGDDIFFNIFFFFLFLHFLLFFCISALQSMTGVG